MALEHNQTMSVEEYFALEESSHDTRYKDRIADAYEDGFF
ncbi:MAG: hypothetical protein NVS4B12_13740 [Ktedonobacteraceae bacterium]